MCCDLRRPLTLCWRTCRVAHHDRRVQKGQCAVHYSCHPILRCALTAAVHAMLGRLRQACLTAALWRLQGMHAQTGRCRGVRPSQPSWQPTSSQKRGQTGVVVITATGSVRPFSVPPYYPLPCRVLAMDLHSGQCVGYFDIPVDHVLCGAWVRAGHSAAPGLPTNHVLCAARFLRRQRHP